MLGADEDGGQRITLVRSQFGQLTGVIGPRHCTELLELGDRYIDGRQLLSQLLQHAGVLQIEPDLLVGRAARLALERVPAGEPGPFRCAQQFINERARGRRQCMADAAVVPQIDPLAGTDGGQLQGAEARQFVAMVHQLFKQDVHDVWDGVLGLCCGGGHRIQPSQPRIVQGTYPNELPKLWHMPALAAGDVIAFELVGGQHAAETCGLGDVLPDPLRHLRQQREVA